MCTRNEIWYWQNVTGSGIILPFVMVRTEAVAYRKPAIDNLRKIYVNDLLIKFHAGRAEITVAFNP